MGGSAEHAHGKGYAAACPGYLAQGRRVSTVLKNHAYYTSASLRNRYQAGRMR